MPLTLVVALGITYFSRGITAPYARCAMWLKPWRMAITTVRVDIDQDRHDRRGRRCWLRSFNEMAGELRHMPIKCAAT